MARALALLLAAASCCLAVSAAAAAPAQRAPVRQDAAQEKHAGATRVAKRTKPRHRRRHAHEGRYGFLPGYRPPAIAESNRLARDDYDGPEEGPFYGYDYYAVPWPRFYRGRWNGGGFGPCYAHTPIGPIWTCGR
jgi:hypothetical protein